MSAVRKLPLLLGVFAGAACAGDYAVKWSTVDGGGGRSQSAPYVVRGTAGQPDAEPLQPASGDAFALVSGYWGIPATPAVDALFADGFEDPG